MPQIQSKYKPLYTSKKRYFKLTGGRGSGKTFVVQDFLVRLMEQIGQGILYTRYTMSSVEKTIIPLFTKHIELIADIKDYNITKTFIENKRTGSFIMFSGIKTSSGDQTANLKTLPNITTWVIEEGEDYNKESSFIDIDDSIRGLTLQNRIIWIQNPTTREHFIYKMFFEGHYEHRKIDGVNYQHCIHPEVEHIHTTYLDNLDNLDPKKVDKWRQTKIDDPKKYANKYIGAWLDKAEGVVYTNWEQGEFDTSLPYVYGLDFGFSPDPTAMVKVAVDNKRKLVYVKEEVYKQELSTDDIEAIIKNRILNNTDLVVADCAEKRLINDLKNTGINITKCRKGAGSIKKGIKDLLSYKLIISKESINLQKELNNYVWNDRKSGVPIDDYNHLLDALRYGFERANTSVNFYAG